MRKETDIVYNVIRLYRFIYTYIYFYMTNFYRVLICD